MDWNSFIEGGWESIVVVLGILGFIISMFSKSGSESKERAKNAASTPKHTHSQTTKKPAKRNVSQGTFTQKEQQNKVLAKQQVILQNSLKEAEREAKRKKKVKPVESSRPQSYKRSRKIRGSLQEAIITKEILDKPVSLRKDR